MRFEADQAKADANRRKHKVGFKEAEAVFESPAIFEDRSHSEDEDRYIAIGFSDKGRLLTVAFTFRGEDTIRIISARNATPSETQQYAQAKAREAAERDAQGGSVSP